MAELRFKKIFYNNGFRLNLPQEMVNELGWSDQTQVVLEIKEKQLIVKKLVLAE